MGLVFSMCLEIKRDELRYIELTYKDINGSHKTSKVGYNRYINGIYNEVGGNILRLHCSITALKMGDGELGNRRWFKLFKTNRLYRKQFDIKNANDWVKIKKYKYCLVQPCDDSSICGILINRGCMNEYDMQHCKIVTSHREYSLQSLIATMGIISKPILREDGHIESEIIEGTTILKTGDFIAFVDNSNFGELFNVLNFSTIKGMMGF